jgi:hypothetical protein
VMAVRFLLQYLLISFSKYCMIKCESPARTISVKDIMLVTTLPLKDEEPPPSKTRNECGQLGLYYTSNERNHGEKLVPINPRLSWARDTVHDLLHACSNCKPHVVPTKP